MHGSTGGSWKRSGPWQPNMAALGKPRDLSPASPTGHHLASSLPNLDPEGFVVGTRTSGQGVSQASGRLGGILGVTCYGLLDALAGPGAGLLLFAGAALLGGLVSATVLREPSPSESTRRPVGAAGRQAPVGADRAS
jgi:hypothetical protein